MAAGPRWTWDSFLVFTALPLLGWIQYIQCEV